MLAHLIPWKLLQLEGAGASNNGGRCNNNDHLLLCLHLCDQKSDLENQVRFAQSPGSSVQSAPGTGTHLSAMEQGGGDG